MKIKIGISPCPNDIFIYSGLILNKINPSLQWEFVFEDIETLNQRAQNEVLDVVKISYANYKFCAQSYSLLPCGGALGNNCGPLLLTHQAAWNPSKPVYIPGEFTTANFLFDYFAKAKYPQIKKIFLPFDELYERLKNEVESQGVVIHEKRFSYVDDDLDLVQDLGAYWESHTGYPIPLGAAILKKSLELSVPGLAAKIVENIRESLQWAYAHHDLAVDLCAQYSQTLTRKVMEQHIALYVNHFTEDLGVKGAEAIEYFLQLQNQTNAQ